MRQSRPPPSLLRCLAPSRLAPPVKLGSWVRTEMEPSTHVRALIRVCAYYMYAVLHVLHVCSTSCTVHVMYCTSCTVHVWVWNPNFGSNQLSRMVSSRRSRALLQPSALPSRSLGSLSPAGRPGGCEHFWQKILCQKSRRGRGKGTPAPRHGGPRRGRVSPARGGQCDCESGPPVPMRPRFSV